MKYYIGVDGGSTKTTFAAAKENGETIKMVTRGGCSYQSVGVDAAVRMLNKEIRGLLASLKLE